MGGGSHSVSKTHETNTYQGKVGKKKVEMEELDFPACNLTTVRPFTSLIPPIFLVIAVA